MTPKKDEIGFIEPGRELDTLIAERVMNTDLTAQCTGEMTNVDDDHWQCSQCARWDYWDVDFEHTIEPLHYSTSFFAAWKVVEEMDKRGWVWFLSKTEITFDKAKKGHDVWGICYHDGGVDIPLAICQAALNALDHETQREGLGEK